MTFVKDISMKEDELSIWKEGDEILDDICSRAIREIILSKRADVIGNNCLRLCDETGSDNEGNIASMRKRGPQ
jgi:hypothetical protein